MEYNQGKTPKKTHPDDQQLIHSLCRFIHIQYTTGHMTSHMTGQNLICMCDKHNKQLMFPEAIRYQMVSQCR